MTVKEKYAKPDRVKKLLRDALLRQGHALSPGLSYAELGEVFNISRQRVERILNRRD